jgi:hypothetical protein
MLALGTEAELVAARGPLLIGERKMTVCLVLGEVFCPRRMMADDSSLAV